MIRSVLAGLVMLLVACGDGGADPDPRFRVIPPAGAPVASVAAEGVTYSLYDTGPQCLTLEMNGPGFEAILEGGCFFDQWNFFRTTEPCVGEPGGQAFAAAGGSEAFDSVTIPCDVRIPIVGYGKLPPSIGFVCLPSIDQHRVRFADVLPGGYLLEVLEGDRAGTTVAFPFTPDGARWGDPPLDAPSNWIYPACEELAPWGGPPPYESSVMTFVELGAGLETRQDLVVRLDNGAGGQAFSLAASPGVPIGLPGLVWSNTTSLGVYLNDASTGSESLLGTFSLPDVVVADAQSGWLCPDPAVLVITIDADVEAVGGFAVAFEGLTSAQAAARIAVWDPPEAQRDPGQPCPGGRRVG